MRVRIEDEISKWSIERRRVGGEVKARVSQQGLHAALMAAYQTFDPNLRELPEDVWQNEQRKFALISAGDFSAGYFAEQEKIIKHIASQVNYPKYLEGYGDWAAGLTIALVDTCDEIGQEQRATYIKSLLASVFVDVAVTMHFFFAAMQGKADAERAEFDREREAEAEADRRSMEALSRALNALADGDLCFRIGDVPAKSATARDNFNAATQKLQSTMQGIADAARHLQDGTGEISQAIQELSKRTENQAATLEQTSASVSEVNSTVQLSTQNARHATEAATEARATVTESNAVMGQAEQAMREISRSSGEIGKIVQVIDNIAMQTNLLSLNASVEAARAGDAGRGFSVVASEVRSLAQRSGEAAKSIRDLIAESATYVKTGEKLVEQTSAKLLQASEKVSQIDQLLKQIAISATEQAEGIDQINVAINNIDRMTQHNAAMAEETNASAVELRHGADDLIDMVAQFRLAEGRGGGHWGHSTRRAG